MFLKHALEAGMQKASEGAMEFSLNPRVSCLLRLKDALSESFCPKCHSLRGLLLQSQEVYWQEVPCLYMLYSIHMCVSVYYMHIFTNKYK